MPEITIAIPAYNQELTIGDTIKSALLQNDVFKEILVIDDCSTDKTVEVVKKYNVRLIENEHNMGIGRTLVKLMDEANGKYVVYLCGDDLFTHPLVCYDIVKEFNTHQEIEIIHRPYYQFYKTPDNPILSYYELDVLKSCCQPSGVALRKRRYEPSNKIFIEMPSIIKQATQFGYAHMMKYDTVAVRIMAENTANKSSYYTESPTLNWLSVLGYKFYFYEGLIQLKNRAPHLLMKEILITIKHIPECLKSLKFWACVFISVLTPRWLLIKMSLLYRLHISRIGIRIRRRPR
jgi:glycosyltransferase involved in cell wall biosynthesis